MKLTSKMSLIVLVGLAVGSLCHGAAAQRRGLAQDKTMVTRIEKQLDRYEQLSDKEIASIDADLRILDQGVELKGNMRDKVTRLQKRFMDLQSKRSVKEEPKTAKAYPAASAGTYAAMPEEIEGQSTIPGGPSIPSEEEIEGESWLA